MKTDNNDLEELKKYIGKEVRIKIKDNRVIEGEFQCIDRELNFIIGKDLPLSLYFILHTKCLYLSLFCYCIWLLGGAIEMHGLGIIHSIISLLLNQSNVISRWKWC